MREGVTLLIEQIINYPSSSRLMDIFSVFVGSTTYAAKFIGILPMQWRRWSTNILLRTIVNSLIRFSKSRYDFVRNGRDIQDSTSKFRLSSGGGSNFTHWKEQQQRDHNNGDTRNETTLTIFLPITYFNPLSLKTTKVEYQMHWRNHTTIIISYKSSPFLHPQHQFTL